MIEVLLVFLTAVAFQVCEHVPGAKGPLIAAAAIFWISYVSVRAIRTPAILRDWGFRREGLAATTMASSVVLILGAVILLGWATMQRGVESAVSFPRSFWLLLLIYPIWGLVQQFLMNALVARNLTKHMSSPATTLLTALLFGVTHLPDLMLTALTVAAALVWVPIYLRWRNLWPLGVCHAWLGALAYYAVLQRDVWGQVASTLG